MRAWFSGKMTAFQAVVGSSILPSRTDEQSEDVRDEQDVGRPAWRIERRRATVRVEVAQISSEKLCVTESVITVPGGPTRVSQQSVLSLRIRIPRGMVAIEALVQIKYFY